MNILLTGASGFLGKVIKQENSNQKFITLGRYAPCDILTDLSVTIPEINMNIDCVIHAAGKTPSLSETAIEKQTFFNVNVKGTENLLKALENNFPTSFIFISSVAVYGRAIGVAIKENSQLLATDFYGKSKIEAEKVVIEWCKTNHVVCTILRLPLIVGTNQSGNLGDMIKGIKKGYYVNIAGGKAKKSMVLATDIAKIIPKVANIGGIYNLTDGYHPSFAEVSGNIAKQLDKPMPLNIPSFLAHLMAKLGDVLGSKSPINTNKLQKISSTLTFDDTKARQILNWQPKRVIDELKINS